MFRLSYVERSRQYSADGKQIILCGDTCAMVKADTDASVQVLFGCTTKPVDPR